MIMGKVPTQTELKNISPKEWLLNYMRAEIDCVAVTDHNSGAWIDPLKQALSELEQKILPSSDPFAYFRELNSRCKATFMSLLFFHVKRQHLT